MTDPVLDAKEALLRLREGNRRFATNVRSLESLLTHTRRAEFASDGQRPFAVVLGCSDSRVPAETVFDQGLGDLFVIRVAGNIVAPSQVGSVEFACERFGTRLVVVLGHTQCGAISATIEALEGKAGGEGQNLRSIVDRVLPSVEGVFRVMPKGDRAAIFREAGRANVRASVTHLRHGSALLERLVQEDGLIIVGAEYSLESGEVEFFDDPVTR
jgi:carbonic anhydrase